MKIRKVSLSNKTIITFTLSDSLSTDFVSPHASFVFSLHYSFHSSLNEPQRIPPGVHHSSPSKTRLSDGRDNQQERKKKAAALHILIWGFICKLLWNSDPWRTYYKTKKWRTESCWVHDIMSQSWFGSTRSTYLGVRTIGWKDFAKSASLFKLCEHRALPKCIQHNF